MSLSRDRAFRAGVAALAFGVILALLAGPGGEPSLSPDPRAIICGHDCLPVSHPWLLVGSAVLVVTGLIGLRIALRKASK